MRWAISKLNGLNSNGKAVPSLDPKEQGVADVDMVGVAEVWEDLDVDMKD